MKINEPFGPDLEQETAVETRAMEAEILAQLKSEFQDFVVQTRERLRMLSESLVELDREYSSVPPALPSNHWTATNREMIQQGDVQQGTSIPGTWTIPEQITATPTTGLSGGPSRMPSRTNAGCR